MSYEQQLAARIYELLRDVIDPEYEKKLRKVIVRCGELEPLDIKLLNQEWSQVAQGPAYQGSFIELHREESQARCNLCSHVFALADSTSKCPRCKHEQFTIVHETPTIEAIDMHETE